VTEGTEARRRNSLRLQEFNYAWAGVYFVTICSAGRQPLFEEQALRRIIEAARHGLPDRFPRVGLDAFVIMPNHLHFVLWLTPEVGAPLAGAPDGGPWAAQRGGEQGRARAGASPAPTLGDVVGAFKSIVATEWLEWVKANDPLRSAKVWQRNYYERIIRDGDELDAVREYIALNPLKWELDRENPEHAPDDAWTRQWGWLESDEEATQVAAAA